MSIHFKIITPVYEVEDFIENALNSVFNQDYDNFEYIITDDGSKDGTVEKIKEFIKKNDCGDLGWLKIMRMWEHYIIFIL